MIFKRMVILDLNRFKYVIIIFRTRSIKLFKIILYSDTCNVILALILLLKRKVINLFIDSYS